MRGGMESGAGGGGDYSGITPDDPNNLTNLEIEAIRSATYAQQKLDEYYEAYNKTQKGIIEKKDKSITLFNELDYMDLKMFDGDMGLWCNARRI